ncbi:MAG: transcriptional regulator [Eubacterium sp.]|nr:transcriptional regulator [Eubacterium sp.]
MEKQEIELQIQQKELYLLRSEIGLNRKEFSEEYGIPLRTIEDWEHGKRKMPLYLLRLLMYKVKQDVRSKII